MIPMTPAQDRSPTFSCPNPAGQLCHRPHAGHMGHRSWTGQPKHMERRRGPACAREFSERAGTLMARSKRAEDTVEQRRKGQRGGVGDEGTADSCAVDLTTVERFPRGATRHAQRPHQPVVQDVDVPGVPWDEAHAQRRPTQGEGVQTA